MAADWIRPPQRIYRDVISNSARWQSYEPRAGDVIVSTPPKSGTTWVQAIVALLIAGDPELRPMPSRNAPWIDMDHRPLDEVMGWLAGQEGRRQVKSHTPYDGLPLHGAVKYISIYRHPLDVHFSFRAHARNLAWPGSGVSFAEDPVESFYAFLEKDSMDDAPLSAIIEHYQSARALDGWPNLLRLHYADMCRDPAAGVARIAAHLQIDHPPALLAQVVAAVGFDRLKARAADFAPGGGTGFWHDDAGFFASGSSGKWQGVLAERDLAAYRARMAELLEPEQQNWLEWGQGA